MDGPPIQRLPPTTSSDLAARSSPDSARALARVAVHESACARTAPSACSPRQRTTTLGELARRGEPAAVVPTGDPDDVIEAFEPGQFLRSRTPQQQRSGAGLAGAALGRMFRPR